MVNSLKELPYEARLKKLGLPSLEYRRLRSDVIEVYKILNQLDRVSINKFFTVMDETTTRGNSLKLFKNGLEPISEQLFSQTELLMLGIYYQMILYWHLP